MQTPAFRSLLGVVRSLFVAVIGALLLGACQPFGAAAPTATAPTGASSGASSSNAANPGELESNPSAIVIEEPVAGAVVSSPMRLRGRLAAVPPQGGLTYRILDAENVLLASGTIATSGESGNGGSFDVQAVYTSLADGPGFVQVVQRDDLLGPAVAVSSRVINLAANVTTPPTAEGLVATGTPNPVAPTSPIIVPTLTPVPSSPTVVPSSPTPLPPTQPLGQAITFNSPPRGTQVGSPLTITGNTNQFPFQGALDYRVVNSANQQLGAGSFPVTGVPGQATSFVAELRFNLPTGGGPVRVDVYDQDNAGGRVAALASLDLVVAPPQPTAGPQQISVSSPPPGTRVGSPVVITGSTTRFPAQGNVKYRFLDQFGNQLGQGAFAVSGSQGQGATFNQSLNFALPSGGGPLRLELVDRDANGQVFASTTLDMTVAPPATVVPQQRITITSPAPNTQVGSPMTITGNTQNYPTAGNLGYRVTDANGQQLGTGAFFVIGVPGQSTTFNAQVLFRLPPNGGVIQVEVLDRDNNTGAVLASNTVRLTVAPPPPPTAVPPYPPSQ